MSFQKFKVYHSSSVKSTLPLFKQNFKTIQKMVVLWLNRGRGMVCRSSELIRNNSLIAAQFRNKGKNFPSKNSLITFILCYPMSGIDLYLWLRGACLWGSMGRYLLDSTSKVVIVGSPPVSLGPPHCKNIECLRCTWLAKDLSFVYSLVQPLRLHFMACKSLPACREI